MTRTDYSPKKDLRLRAAIVGAGLMGRWHAHCVARTGAPLVAVADPDLARAELIGRRYGARSYRGLGDMLAAGNIDILHVCTSTASHAPIIRQALEHGIHVLVEKPLAETAARTAELCDLARRSGRRLCPVHQYAFQRSVERIMSQRGRIGTPTHLELKFFSAGADDVPMAQHPRVAADILPHPISIIQRLYPGAVLDPAGWRIADAGPSGWEILSQIDEVFLRISISLNSRPTCAALILRGDHGSFVADLFHDFVRFRDGAVSRRAKMMRPFRDGAGQLSGASLNLARRMLRREPAYPGLRGLVAGFQAACAGQAAAPIEAAEMISAAAVRDWFVDATGAAPIQEASA